jgi:acyl carrier protein
VPVQARVADILAARSPLGVESARPEDLLVGDLGFDSLGLVQAVLAVEDAFEVELPQDRLPEVREARVVDLARLVEEAREQ